MYRGVKLGHDRHLSWVYLQNPSGKHHELVLNRKAAWFSLLVGEFHLLACISHMICGHHNTSSVICVAEKHILPL